ncbi:hypothetical protein KQX54_010824 [Cotesia glomerata]|uniref:Uncharacterized protein n=1 Tax=Cotesia glomerata TaxID=32391 RepID=A0AAV7J428_COTGL|nr:hypothetical protein KQX54_010824 [Cotesia glomerata]
MGSDMSARQRIRLRFEAPPSVNPSFQYAGQLCLTFFTTHADARSAGKRLRKLLFQIFFARHVMWIRAPSVRQVDETDDTMLHLFRPSSLFFLSSNFSSCFSPFIIFWSPFTHRQQNKNKKKKTEQKCSLLVLVLVMVGVEASASWVASVNLPRVSIGCLSASVNGSLCNLNNYDYRQQPPATLLTRILIITVARLKVHVTIITKT